MSNAFSSFQVRVLRAWAVLAPKLIAFLATGLTVTAATFVLTSFGITLDPVLVTIAVGGLSSVAAFIQRDNLLILGPGQFSLKVIAFILTSVSATTIVALFGVFGVDLAPYAPAIGIIVTAIGAVIGYLKSDVAFVDEHEGKHVATVPIA